MKPILYKHFGDFNRYCPTSLIDVLKPYTDFAVPFLGINVPLRSVLLVGWFHYHPRVLDAWVAKHVSTAREQFSKKQTVRDRNYHIPLPVVLDGVTVPQLNPSVLAPALSTKRSRIVIFGEGGLGKTSLANNCVKTFPYVDAIAVH